VLLRQQILCADTTAKCKRMMEEKEFDYSWVYCSVIGKLNYLEKSTRGDLAFSVHQCTRYMSQPMRAHREAVKRIGRYLLGTREKGFIVRPDVQKSFECYVDADYCGNRDPHSEDPNSAKSRSVYVIMYHGCPILWASRLQSVFALSTTEAEYVALSTALRDIIPVMDLLKEMQDQGHDVVSTPTIKCKHFEDNSGALEQAKTAKDTSKLPGTIVVAGLIQIRSIQTDWQLGDTFAKQVSTEDFIKFRRLIFGW
jgi:hypothetical protein